MRVSFRTTFELNVHASIVRELRSTISIVRDGRGGRGTEGLRRKSTGGAASREGRKEMSDRKKHGSNDEVG